MILYFQTHGRPAHPHLRPPDATELMRWSCRLLPFEVRRDTATTTATTITTCTKSIHPPTKANDAGDFIPSSECQTCYGSK